MAQRDILVVVCSCGESLTLVYQRVLDYGTKLEPLATFPESAAAAQGLVKHVASVTCSCGKRFEAENGEIFCNGKLIGSVPE